MREYGDIAFAMLRSGTGARDVVEDVIKLMEDDPSFDAGTGSFYNLNGDVEMDAMIMDATGKCGGVVCIKEVQHPISVARRVMEDTPHVLLSGEGALQFARKCGFPYYDPGTAEGKAAAATKGRRMLGDIKYYTEERSRDGFYSTVGIVALDTEGGLAIGTSTGGIRQKLPGRVGDSAIMGAGGFCDAKAGAVATGEGEGILKIGLTRFVVDRYSESGDLKEACKEGIRRGTAIDCVCGVVALSADGRFSYASNGAFMPVYANRG
jgi:beta-aspartyl-peptidase (threonine type)